MLLIIRKYPAIFFEGHNGGIIRLNGDTTFPLVNRGMREDRSARVKTLNPQGRAISLFNFMFRFKVVLISIVKTSNTLIKEHGNAQREFKEKGESTVFRRETAHGNACYR